MKKLLKVLGITIALTAIGVGVRAISKDINYTPSKWNDISDSNVKIVPNGIRTKSQQY